jgi:ABC-type transport system involved in multi-copper enzyme maturation permease subunit
MNFAFRLRQALLIARLELARAFFSKRAFWVYGLALFPMLIFLGHGLDTTWKRQRARGSVITREQMDSVTEGMQIDEVRQRLGKPVRQWESEDREEKRKYAGMTYFDGGNRRMFLNFTNGMLTRIENHKLVDFDEDRTVFATVFQYFYLRLAIFFGCLGIFMNLFRGEMLDKTLHYWMLAPARRETLLAGKYLAGVTAAVAIFGIGTAVCFYGVLWYQNPAEVRAYWAAAGPAHLFWYVAASSLACVGYGSVFVAAGLLVRNPIVPAVILLLWESIHGFLPAALQKLSVLYYVQSLCPIPPVDLDEDMPALIKMLLSPAEPASAAMAVLGVLGVTVLVLWVAARTIRRVEINYGTE